MKTALAVFIAAASISPVTLAAGDQEPNSPSTTTTVPAKHCDHRCQIKHDYGKLRRATPREAIPTYISSCESGGSYRALNPSSGAGGKYQVLPSTWAGAVPRDRHGHLSRSARVAESVRVGFRRLPHHDLGPRMSSPLLQDMTARIIWNRDGPGAWSCS